MRRSKTEIYLHFVWAVRLRERVLLSKTEAFIHEQISLEAEKLHCQLLALNGTEDHVHTLVRVPGKVSGAWVLRGTRMPVSAIFENIEAGASINDIMDWFDGLDREQVKAVIEFAASQTPADFAALMDGWHGVVQGLFEDVHALLSGSRSPEEAWQAYRDLGVGLAWVGLANRDEILLAFRESRTRNEAGAFSIDTFLGDVQISVRS